MAAKAHEISLEAGSKMAAAMKDVVNAAAGITGFVLESARDLVQYTVRRGQMTQEEADKLIRQAEEAQEGRPKPAPKAADKAEKPAIVHEAQEGHEEPAAAAAKVPAKAPAKKVEKTEKTAKPAAKTATKTAAKKAPAKKK
jgi:polyhydroxyalkanoate synthesis regulator phasin